MPLSISPTTSADTFTSVPNRSYTSLHPPVTSLKVSPTFDDNTVCSVALKERFKCPRRRKMFPLYTSGSALHTCTGAAVGFIDGSTLGITDGKYEGSCDGDNDGKSDGFVDGACVKSTSRMPVSDISLATPFSDPYTSSTFKPGKISSIAKLSDDSISTNFSLLLSRRISIAVALVERLISSGFILSASSTSESMRTPKKGSVSLQP
mmetsp:Transcript_6606/g.9339  ORF Transcript_6606/g.9339 Transcript_6606/m.9339 type:complete len:207 (+) Transcript_6606:408-1028(+)